MHYYSGSERQITAKKYSNYELNDVYTTYFCNQLEMKYGQALAQAKGPLKNFIEFWLK